MSDLFHDGVPLSYISGVVATMTIARWHNYRVLTKRSEQVRQLLSGPGPVLFKDLVLSHPCAKPSKNIPHVNAQATHGLPPRFPGSMLMRLLVATDIAES